jgi:HJR/Mrr/RecB family endonuclease
VVTGNVGGIFVTDRQSMSRITTEPTPVEDVVGEISHRCSTVENRLRDAKLARWRSLAAITLREVRYLSASFGAPPWCIALTAGSISAILFSTIIITLGFGTPILVLCCCLFGYILGGGGGFFAIQDDPGETDENRKQLRHNLLFRAQETLRAVNVQIAGLRAELSVARADLQRRAREDRIKLLTAAEAAKNEAEARASAANAALVAAREELEGLQGSADLAIARLLAVEAGRLYWNELEQFVADIFQHLGYAVTSTGQTGDQGVDVLAERPGRKLAIQVKCYGSPVGNKAVQEVVAGMAHYGCNRCVVLSNNYFTPSAQELAASNGCVLIDRDGIPALIRGEFGM